MQALNSFLDLCVHTLSRPLSDRAGRRTRQARRQCLHVLLLRAVRCIRMSMADCPIPEV